MTSDFSAGVRAEAARENPVPVVLMNGEQLVTHEFGVARRSHDLLELDEESLDKPETK